MQFSQLEIDWVAKNFPDLRFNKKTNEFTGCLRFSATYDEKQDKVIFDPEHRDKNFIKCDYVIKITFNAKYYFQIIDTDNKIKKSSKKKKIKNDYIHINEDRSICLVGPQRFKELRKEIRKLDNKIEKIIYLAIQFFYHQTYVLKFNKEPWKGFIHGSRGIQQELQEQKQNLYTKKERYYNEQVSLKLKQILEKGKIKRNKKCPCGSDKKYKHCHYKEIQNIINTIGGFQLIKMFIQKKRQLVDQS